MSLFSVIAYSSTIILDYGSEGKDSWWPSRQNGVVGVATITKIAHFRDGLPCVADSLCGPYAITISVHKSPSFIFALKFKLLSHINDSITSPKLLHTIQPKIRLFEPIDFTLNSNYEIIVHYTSLLSHTMFKVVYTRRKHLFIKS